MAVEARRGCGYRKIGGTYLVSGPEGIPCDRLPFALTVCPVCSCGIKQTRGWTWVNKDHQGSVYDRAKKDGAEDDDPDFDFDPDSVNARYSDDVRPLDGDEIFPEVQDVDDELPSTVNDMSESDPRSYDDEPDA